MHCTGSSVPSTASSSWSRELASLVSLLLPGGSSLLDPTFISVSSSSIPNPLFDLAGITCGHFLVPFWTFFGATLIGKAVIKMHIQVGPLIVLQLTWFHFQKIFVILAFNKELFEGAVSLLVQIPVLGKDCVRDGFCDVKAKMVNIAGARLEGPVRKLLAQQREKLHSKGEGQQVLTKPN